MSPPRYLLDRRHAGCPPTSSHGEDPGSSPRQLVALARASLRRSRRHRAIEEYGAAGRATSPPLGSVLDACRTPPFLADAPRHRRSRRRGPRLGTASASSSPTSPNRSRRRCSSVAVLGRRAAAALAKAVAAAGGVVLTAEPGSGAVARQQWFTEHLAEAPVRLDGAAAALLDRHLGEDLARLDALLAALASAYGEHARISSEELEPFLGTAGDSTPWELTDALAEGDAPRALDALHRQLTAGRHPLQLLASLHRHYGALLRLDGAEITDEHSAAAATGLSPFPARKALEQSRRLGHERVIRAITLLAGADLDLRGRVAWPGELVLEVLVARLAQLTRLHGGTRPARSRGSTRGHPPRLAARRRAVTAAPIVPERELPALLSFAEGLARRAGRLLREATEEVDSTTRFARAKRKSSPTDLVTELDRASEALITHELGAARPEDAVLGEEGTSRDGTSGLCWVIDPLDGTTNFVYGYGSYAVSIGLARRQGGPPRRGARPGTRGDLRREPRRRGDNEWQADLGALRSGPPRAGAARDGLRLQRERCAPSRRACSRGCCRRCATFAGVAPRPSTSAASPAAASTATSRPASGRGTSPPAS